MTDQPTELTLKQFQDITLDYIADATIVHEQHCKRFESMSISEADAFKVVLAATIFVLARMANEIELPKALVMEALSVGWPSDEFINAVEVAYTEEKHDA
ncbi:hypothetical protein UFOVP235_66 [uncultured Caudovirales phage]|uniref:Uncharacterized protein n=1 Tax=uncultured Caudovirales phage TaxID=2100421 RepID=A0A6J7WRS9_9CAUD|nr:hypothetical protein UFOVP235_66 [uncultured Caudovirales phage]